MKEMKNEKDPITRLFDRLQDEFDTAQPTSDHRQRFLQKLQQQNENRTTTVVQTTSRWWKHIAAACVVLLALGVFIGTQLGNSQQQTQVTFSPEVEKSQLYFASIIEKELEKIKAAENEDTKEIVQDALAQLERLENDYEKLKNQLVTHGHDKRILHAMITNFQLRIELLENVLQQIEELKLFKNEPNFI